MRKLLSGNEAIALGAWEAGVKFAAAYPGTPSTEIMENLFGYDDLKAEWASNEKVALDAASGAALVGARALAAMKHVGLNVAADTFFSLSYTGVKAGLVIVSADDPGAFSSQNEQDNRHYARFAKMPCVEPSDSQEAKDFVAVALDLSEEFDTPVLFRSTTRLSHSKSSVELGTRKASFDENSAPLVFPDDPQKYVIIPAHARLRHPIVEERLQRIAGWAETASINRLEWGDRRLGIVTSGVAYQYAREVFGDVSYLKLGLSYPLPLGLIRQLREGVEKLIIVEELDPFFEEHIRAAGIQVDAGKDVFPMTGEFTVPIVREAAARAGLIEKSNAPRKEPAAASLDLPHRLPAFCPGCPHRSVFYALRKQKLQVSGDIGCYSIGVLPPFNAMNTILSMGAGLGMAHGMGQAGVEEKFVAVIGDSTFFHTGLPALASTVYNRGVVTTLVLDNFTTAMTGGQDNPGQNIEIEPVVRALGVEHVWTVDAFDQEAVEKAIKEAVAIDDRPTVVVVHGSCVLIKGYTPKPPLIVDADACTACGICFRVGCPAILKSEETALKSGKNKAVIDPLLCVGCEICSQVCPFEAIHKV